MKKIVFHLSFLFLMMCPPGAFSQTANIIYFNTEHGLPQSTVNNIVQDKQGNLWIGTVEGVCKYNGLVFKNYSRKNGLAENWVTSSCIDHSGNIWFGHWTGGISRYNSKKDSMEMIVQSDVNITKPISKIVEDKDGVMWFASEGAGVLSLKVSDSLATKAFEQYSSKDGLGSNIVFCIMQDKEGTMWFGTEAGISKLKNKVFSNISSRDGLPSKSIISLFQDDSENIWVGSKDAGVFIYPFQVASGRDFSAYSKKYDLNSGLRSNFVTTIISDREKNFWIGTNGGGVTKILNPDAKSYYRMLTTDEGLSSNKVLSILQDREGSIWIGTFVGLNQYRAETFQTYGKQEGLSNSLVWSLACERNGTFWLGTEGGLVKFSPNTVKEKWFSNVTAGKSFRDNNITSVMDDKAGNIWFSAWGEGVGRINTSTGKIERIQVKDGLPEDKIYSIASDKEGGIWFGTSKSGACRFDPVKKTFRIYKSDDGLGNDRVVTIFRDSKNNLWFGTLGGYVTKFDGSTFKTFSEKSGLLHSFVLSITEDKTGNIWIGTYGGGLYKFDGTAFTNYDVTDGMYSDTPFLLSPDGDNLWVGTSLGIDRFSMAAKTFSHYGKDEGFLGIEINPNAVYRDSSGNIWFGTIGGLVKYNPGNDKKNSVEPTIHLNGFKVLSRDVNPEQLPRNETFNAILSYRENSITFNFIGVSLANPKKVRYIYKLEGLDNEWSPETAINTITYQNIHHGEYTFLVKACNNDGVWSEVPAKFSFVIKPPFWQTIWFYILYVLLIVVFVYLVILIRTKTIIKEKKILEHKVMERTIEIQQKNKDITDSIIYAKRIQEAILPIKEEVTGDLKNSFIFYKPRDIVSGDFFWYSKLDDKICIGAVDCTGHGVPGALMSIIGNELLNQIINGKSVHDPAQVLTMLNDGVRTALKQDKKDSETRDGMDIALSFFYPKTGRLEFAGANRPLYIVRKNKTDLTAGNYVEVIKGTKFPIGGMQLTEKTVFVKHSLQLNSGDSFYMFTDGYIDQFGGAEGRKFMAKPFRDLLVEISKTEFDSQGDLLGKEFKKWIGNYEQVDDVLVIGVKS